jgi:flagellar basal-body rod protein FlgF
MADGMYTALSGAMAQEQALEVVANNLANIATTGFKGETVDFKQVLATQDQNATSVHVEVAQTQHDFSQGVLKETDNPLDVALLGAGFFVVDAPQGEMLTRHGALALRGDGYLQSVDGLLVQGQQGNIRISPGSKVRIDSYGAVMATPPGSGKDGTNAQAETMVDRLRVVDVENPQALRRYGNGLWDPSGSVVQRVETPVEAGSLETSNANPIKMMTQLIAVQRAYESYNRSIETIRTMEQKATSQLG